MVKNVWDQRIYEPCNEEDGYRIMMMSMPDEEDVDVECWKDCHGEREEKEKDVADSVIQLISC